MAARECIEVIARGLVCRQGKVLVCRNRKNGYCFLPGGHIEFGEGARVALRREFMEETGHEVDVTDFCLATEATFQVGVRTHHEVNLVFLVELTGDATLQVASRERRIEFEWLAIQELERADFRPPSVCAWIQRWGAPRVSIDAASWVSEVAGE